MESFLTRSLFHRERDELISWFGFERCKSNSDYYFHLHTLEKRYIHPDATVADILMVMVEFCKMQAIDNEKKKTLKFPTDNCGF